ncbi:MAG: substrate-binding domain-containing protein [Acidimicrobiales bacterium]
MTRSATRRAAVAACLAAVATGLLMPAVAAADTGIVGAGSSFAQPEVATWITDTAGKPYSLNVQYSGSSSGDGRLKFADQTVDFGVTDIQYEPYPYDTKSPSFPFIYIPVTAGGLAFMYHIDGLSKPLQLSAYSACAIFTGGVTNWNDPVIARDNPGVSLPNLTIHPVTRDDPAGTNYVLEEWCIHDAGTLWANFANSPQTQHYPDQVQDLSPTQPHSHWPHFANAIYTEGSAPAADTVADPTKNGYITAVETSYAVTREQGCNAAGTCSNGVGTVLVKNASGDYTAPTPSDVASALAYATQLPNGTHQLNFDGAGPHVYNPSTYSYMIVPTTGWDPAKGKVVSEYLDYALTLGQQRAPEINYASLGLSLEQYGVNEVRNLVPGAVATPTAAEQAAYACGDLTPAEVQQGRTSPTCGVTNPQTAAAAQAAASSSSAGGASAHAVGTNGRPGSGGGVYGGGGAGASVDPGVSLGGSTPLAFTGGNPAPIVLAGSTLVVVGVLARRRLSTRKPAEQAR